MVDPKDLAPDPFADCDEDDSRREMNCERCQSFRVCECIPFMGYSLWLCESCAAAAYHSGEAV